MNNRCVFNCVWHHLLKCWKCKRVSQLGLWESTSNSNKNKCNQVLWLIERNKKAKTEKHKINKELNWNVNIFIFGRTEEKWRVFYAKYSQLFSFNSSSFFIRTIFFYSNSTRDVMRSIIKGNWGISLLIKVSLHHSKWLNNIFELTRLWWLQSTTH